ncbi:MAG: Vancomycin B-type resistance protein VanW [Saprospiraceae bacterium]|nr:Vancomycin B-type resistance protein VanW [Saprospiraceae bacterium]
MTPPVHRSPLRRRLGRWCYIQKRRLVWLLENKKWATQIVGPLNILVFQHNTPLLRQLKDVEMYLQHNKVTNLRLAAAKINGLVIRPGETFSFWKTVGNPTARRGYLEGLVLENGKIGKGVGGGLCQMGNLLYWMALHSPLTVTERWRHSYDVFPDAGRILPFGSGATLAYNYIDLQFRNDTRHCFQLRVWLSETQLCGEIRSSEPLAERYEVFEQEHVIRHEPWGGYSRHNRIARWVYCVQTNELLREEPVTENHALMMYQPFLEGKR